MQRHIKAAVLLVVMALTLGAALPARAGVLPITITITKTAIENDDGNGCSLYEALQAIFSSVAYHQCPAGSDINLIVFSGAAAGGTTTFPAKPSDIDLPMINKNVTITGPVVIDGNGANTDQHIFRIAPGGTLNLANMVIRNAHTSGGGAAVLDLNRGTLNIVGVSFDSNVAEGDGGAINSNGTLNILSSNFVANKAQGIMPDKSINPSTGYGGAINMTGSDKLKLALTNFSGNLADKGGGALYHSSQGAEISDVIFSGNIVNGTGANDKAPKGGGAIYNDADTPITVIRSAFNGNLTPTSNGGAFYNAIDATAVISDTSFNGNIAGAPGSAGMGGAIYNPGGDLNVARATFLANAAIGGDGGAIANDRRGDAIVANSSFTANAAANGNGGAINNTTTQQGGPASSVVAKNVTFSANVALNSSSHGGAIFNAQGHSFTLGNTIVDKGPVDIGYTGDNCTGTITSLGHNLDSQNTCGFDQAGDKPNANPQLDSPAFNGGPLATLLTQKLNAGSDAIDAGDPAICAAHPVNNVDQRGEARPKGARCDIGSFESDALVAGYGSTPVQPGPIPFGNTFATGANTVETTFSIFETGNTTLTVSNPQITGANAGDFTVKAPSPFPISIQDGFPERIVTLVCDPSAVGARTATLTLDTNDPAHQHVSYNLTCSGTTQPASSYDSDPLAPGPIDFGDVVVNASANANLTINNTGDAALSVSNPALGGANPGDFKVVTVFPLAIAAGASSSVALQCKPLDIGIRTATLTVTTNDPNRATVAYTLACNGQQAPPPILDDPGQSVGNTPAKGLDGAYGVAISPDGQNVYVTGYFSKAVAVFKRDAVTGGLTALAPFTNAALDGLNGARLITVSPDGKNVYVASQGASAIVTIDRDINTGLLSANGTTINGGPIGTDLTFAYGVVVSPDGRFVYVTGNAIPNGTVVVFTRDTTHGWLTYLQTIKDGAVDGAHGLAISPDGTNLYVTAYAAGNSATGHLVTYKRDAVTGKLTRKQDLPECDDTNTCFIYYMDGLGGAFQVTVSPDGQFVYAVGTYDGSVVVFRRDASDGTLSHIRTYKDGIGGVNGLAGVSGVAISPDGRYLFATGYGDKAIVVFERDATTGLLSLAQLIQRNPLSGGPAQPLLDGARDIRISPDGASVYAAAFVDDAVVGLHTANPVPTLLSLAPASAQAGSATLTLAVNGANFMPGAKLHWNGATRSTSFVNSTQLTAQIAAADLAAAGTVDITVVNPPPGGGVSNLLKFTLSAPGQNPVPSIATLVPASAPAGGAAFTLTVNGSNFIAGSKLRWNGADRTTSFVSATQLTAQIGAADIAQPGPVGITVVNPGPGGGSSNAATFDIAAPGENPTPSIAAISPNKVMADVASATAITLVVSGVNFMDGSQAQWNGANRPTTFVSSTQLKMTVTAADIALGGKGSVTVINPTPGGGASNTATFTVIPIRSRVYLPFLRR
jgi:predicted outer membrane repeat protein